MYLSSVSSEVLVWRELAVELVWHCSVVTYKMEFSVSFTVLCLHELFFFFLGGGDVFVSHYLAQAGLALKILLPQPPTCWDYTHWKPHPTYMNSYSCTKRESTAQPPRHRCLCLCLCPSSFLLLLSFYIFTPSQPLLCFIFLSSFPIHTHSLRGI